MYLDDLVEDLPVLPQEQVPHVELLVVHDLVRPNLDIMVEVKQFPVHLRLRTYLVDLLEYSLLVLEQACHVDTLVRHVVRHAIRHVVRHHPGFNRPAVCNKARGFSE